MYANLCAKSNAAQILFRRRESHAVTKSARPGDLQSVQFFYCATSIEMGDDIAKMLHIHMGFFQLLGYTWDPALIIALTLLGLGLIKINDVSVNFNNPRPSLILNN